MKVRDAMHAGVTCVGPETSLADIARMMRDQDIGAIPICDNDRLAGMVTDRDIACRGLADGRDVNTLCARDVMSKPIIYCTAEEEVEDAVRLMETKQIRRLPVIDGQKRMVGMLALGDIATCTNRALSGEVLSHVAEHHA